MTHAAPSYFSLFDLPERFALDTADLERTYRRLQAVIHPDKFAGGTETERRIALQSSARINEAYRMLRNPSERGNYLLSLRGITGLSETDTSMPPEFLSEQMEQRELLAQFTSRRDIQALRHMLSEIKLSAATLERQLCQEIDRDQAWDAAKLSVRKLKFLEKLIADIDEAIVRMEDRDHGAVANS